MTTATAEKETTKATLKSKISFDVCKSDLKKIIKAHKKFALQGKEADLTPFGFIEFEIDDDELKLTTTNGDKLLKSYISIDNFEENGKFLLSMELVSKLSFVKTVIDTIRIEVENGEAKFIDPVRETVQTIKLDKKYHFPDVANLIETKGSLEVALQIKYLKDVCSMTTNEGYLKLYFNPKRNIAPVFAETSFDNGSQTALIMPLNFEPIDKN